MSPAGSASNERVRLALLACIVLAFVAYCLYLTSAQVVDDAYIAFRYSKNLAQGAGLTFNVGDAPVEGYTCFSWVILGALFTKVGVEPAVALPLIGIVCGAATLGVVARVTRRLNERAGASPAWASGIAGALSLACMPGFAYYAGSGLETPLYVLCAVSAVGAALLARPNVAAGWAVLALLTRPEGAAIAAFAWALGMARSAPEDRRRWIRAGLAALAVVVAYAAFKKAYFGALLPNTLAAKPPELRASLTYVRFGLQDASGIYLVALVVGCLQARRARHLGWLVGAFGLCVLIAVVEGPDWMRSNRFLLPALAFAAFLVDSIFVGVDGAALTRPMRKAAMIALLPGAAYFARYAWFDVNYLRDESRGIEQYEPFRDSFAQRITASGVKSIGTLDIGRLSHACPSLRLLDLGGLTDAEIAHTAGDYRSKTPDETILRAKAPDGFLFTSREAPIVEHVGTAPKVKLFYPVEARIAEMPWFRAHYRIVESLPIRSDYYLHWYRRLP